MSVRKIILGTVQFGLDYGVNNPHGKVSFEEAQLILSEAYNNGIRNLDTAEAYGTAHEVIGGFHKSNPDKIFNVITKIPANDAEENIEAKLEKYLSQLQVEKLEALMFHAFSTYKKSKTIIPLLTRLKDNGTFKQLGVSIYTNNELEEVIADENIDLIQLPFNLLDNASLRGQLLEEAKSKNKTIHSRSAFLQGLFFKNLSDNNKVVKVLKPELNAIHTIALDEKISIAELALGYCLQQQSIDNVLIGVDSVEQLKKNMEASDCKISRDAVEKINTLQTLHPDLLNPSLWDSM